MLYFNNKNDMDTAKFVVADTRCEILCKMIDLNCTVEQRTEIDKLFNEMIQQYIEQKNNF